MVETSDDRRKRLERQDHGHELAGLETGRRTRFGIGQSREEQIKEERRKDRAYRDALDRLLATDPEYRKLYKDLGNRLSQAETEADQAIAAVEAALAEQQRLNQDMCDRAPKIDGKAVFRYADGRVVDEDGNEIDAVIAAGIVWPDDAVSAERFFAAMEQEHSLRSSLGAWYAYRNETLGGIRDRYDDRDTPMSKDELRDAIKDIQSTAPDIPQEAAQPAESADTVTSAPQALLTLDN